MRKRFIFCLAAAVCCLAGSAVMAESLGTCINTGYTFMGGVGKYDQTGKDYFLVGNAPASEPGPDDEMWAFSWLKFDNLPGDSVAEAWLSIERTAQPGFTQPSAAQPMDVFVQAVAADVAGIMAGDVVDFKENHILPGILATATITDPGIYCWEITSLVNGWIDTGVNNGLVLTGWDSNAEILLHPYFGGLPDGGAFGSLVPTLATTPVPEPAAIAMLVGLGLLGLVGVFRKR